MADKEEKAPRYMARLLEELGWNEGTRIPLANPDNQFLETILINRQNEIQRLKESLILQKQKRDDLDKYKHHVQTEYQENTRLLFAHKQQLEQEVKLRQLSTNEVDILERDILDHKKQTNTIKTRLDRLQSSIGRLLKKADTLKTEVCGERGALQEWRAALERNANDITSIEQFTKQDVSKAKELETRKQRLITEHNQMEEKLHQIIANLSAEERACERISVQVIEGMEQRKQMMTMWTAAIENLRQRDTDIRHIREDYAVLEEEANRLSEQCREQQNFYEQQHGNNKEAVRENGILEQKLVRTRMTHQATIDQNQSLDSEIKSVQRELANMKVAIEKLNMQNRQLLDEQHKKDVALHDIDNKTKELKEKLLDSTDKTRSSEKRAKELEDILNEEEHYASQVTANQQRAAHCSYVEQQKLLALKNEEKLFHMQLKASKAIMSKLDTKQAQAESKLQSQKETLYSICYQVETIGARVMHMEGAQSDRECSAELLERENRLKHVMSRHAARVALLERHSSKLLDDMRRLTRELEARTAEHTNLQCRLRTSVLEVEGSDKESRALRADWRSARVEEALLRLRAEHAGRALAGLGRAALSIDAQRLQLDAAMSERLVEIGARREMFSVQRRALLEDCGRIKGAIREREQRVEQLIKRYDIFIASLGKDDAGQQLSVTFFKIKFAAERAELRERGASLDAQIARLERDVRAVEAALRLLHAAHHHFLHHITPLEQDTPEIQELNKLNKEYYEKRDELKELNARTSELQETVNEIGSQLTLVNDKYKQLTAKESECENELESARERLQRQESRLQNAHDVVRQNARRAKKLVEGVDEWRIFQVSLWVRDYWEAAQGGLRALGTLCAEHTQAYARTAAALSSGERTPPDPRLRSLLQKFLTDASALTSRESGLELAESVFSTSKSSSSKSGASVASGYTKRLTLFRKTLAPKVQEKALIDDIREQARRSSVSLRVVTLGLEESSVMPSMSQSGKRKTN